MFPAKSAIAVTRNSVRSVGNLFPIENHPIRTQEVLKDLRIKSAKQVDELKVRILKNLLKEDPPHSLNKGLLRDIDTSTTVGAIAAIVRNADPV